MSGHRCPGGVGIANEPAQVTAEQYAMWTAEQRAGIEIVDGMVLVRPSASKRHNRLARLLANALDAAGGRIGTLTPISIVLDPATRRYREGEVFTDVVKLTAPFLFEVDLGRF